MLFNIRSHRAAPTASVALKPSLDRSLKHAPAKRERTLALFCVGSLVSIDTRLITQSTAPQPDTSTSPVNQKLDERTVPGTLLKALVARGVLTVDEAATIATYGDLDRQASTLARTLLSKQSITALDCHRVRPASMAVMANAGSRPTPTEIVSLFIKSDLPEVLRAGVRCPRSAQVAGRHGREDALHRVRFVVGERLPRELQLEAA